jgi:hypothetical protein
LAERLYREAVTPILRKHAPGLPHAAGLLGAGSDVLGFDTERSTDHDWGPRLVLFLREGEIDAWRPRLDGLLRSGLPREIAGYPTGFYESSVERGTTHMATGEEAGPVNHRIMITTAARFLDDRLGILDTGDLTPAQWLTVREQSLLEITAGAVFHDDVGEITRMRNDLAWYPDEVWRYRMAAQWNQIDQIEPFVGRPGEVGDDLGSHLVAMALVRDVMRLAFLMERQYAPYQKWFGTAFSRLALAPALTPHLDQARFAREWREREAGIVVAVETLAHHHNAMGLTEWVDPAPTTFFGRPFRVLFAGRFGEALMATITDPVVKALPAHLGGIDQYIDATDAMNHRGLHHAIRDWLAQSAAPDDSVDATS